jgi:hypothetical protein
MMRRRSGQLRSAMAFGGRRSKFRPFVAAARYLPWTAWCALSAVVFWGAPAHAGNLIVNGDFVAEDFSRSSTAWQAVDNKWGTPYVAEDQAVWPDKLPYYGAFLRTCQSSTPVDGQYGGVRGAYIQQEVALRAGYSYTLSLWAAHMAVSELVGGAHGGQRVRPDVFRACLPDARSLEQPGKT